MYTVVQHNSEVVFLFNSKAVVEKKKSTYFNNLNDVFLDILPLSNKYKYHYYKWIIWRTHAWGHYPLLYICCHDNVYNKIAFFKSLILNKKLRNISDLINQSWQCHLATYCTISQQQITNELLRLRYQQKWKDYVTVVFNFSEPEKLKVM